MGQLLAALRRAVVLMVVLAAPIGASAQSAPVPSTAFGPEDAPVVLTVFSDFGCEPCAHLAVVLHGVVEARPNTVRVVFRHVPADDSRGRDAHLASLAAAEQGRFFDFHNIVFANQDRLTREDTVAMASQLGLDLERFAESLGRAAWADVLARDRAEAEAKGVSQTPALLVNGVAVPGPITLATLLERIGAAANQ